MSLGCAGCGDCCDPVHLDAPQAWKIESYLLAYEREGGVPDPEVPRDDTYEFARLHWTKLGPASDGGTEYSCDQFDPTTRRCLAHETRPNVCRSFPWYGSAPEAMASGLYTRCSYALDVPRLFRRADARPLIPITVVTR